jgi:hypothetical protein
VNGEDPGWGSPGNFLLAMLPGGARLVARRADDGLVLLRILFISFCSSVLLFGVVLLLLGGGQVEDGPAPGPWGLALSGYGVVALAATRLVERPLSCDSDVALAGGYRTRFFLRLAFSESVALFGFVLVFVVGPAWLYFLGAAFTAVGFARLAPTRSNLERDQQALLAAGCTRSVVGALRGNPARP